MSLRTAIYFTIVDLGVQNPEQDGKHQTDGQISDLLQHWPSERLICAGDVAKTTSPSAIIHGCVAKSKAARSHEVRRAVTCTKDRAQ